MICFQGKSVMWCVSLLISLSELDVGNSLPWFPGQLGKGSMEIKQPQPGLDTASSLDNPEALLGRLIHSNRPKG